MSTLSLLPTTAAVPRSTTFDFPVLTILGAPGLDRDEWFKLRPIRDEASRQIIGSNLFLPAGMSASRQLDEIESAVAELRRHIAPDGSFTMERVPTPEQPRTPQLTLVPAQRRVAE